MASLSLKGIYKSTPAVLPRFPISIWKSRTRSLSSWSALPAAVSPPPLRMIAGLEEISDGELYIGDKLVNDVAPKDRDIAMVFQNYALYPHMTVFENMAFRPEAAQDPEG